MAIERQTIVYEGPGGLFEGVIALDTDWTDPRPGVLVLPNVLGQKESDNVRAEELAELGYVGFAVDIYGQGKRPVRDSPDMMNYMNELNADRPLLRDRLHNAVSVFENRPEVDTERMAAIGFCFGGKCVLDMARTGADLRGVVSFHGAYDAPPFPNITPVRPKVLVCHGWDDPLCPPEATVRLANELTESGADWQIHAYGHTGHGFTDQSANMPERGVMYQPDAARRSWQAMINFLAEIFG